MKFSAFIAAAAALIGVVSAAAAKPSLPLKRGQFYLQTKSSVAKFNGLWLLAYHTGAGLNDAVLSSNVSYAIPAYLAPNSNRRLGGNLTFDLGTEFKWGFQLEYEPYTAFSPTTIPAGDGQTFGFSFSGSTLQFNNQGLGASNDFGGWLACYWWHPDIDHGVNPAPQLFWRQVYNKDFNPPVNCGKVDLIKRVL